MKTEKIEIPIYTDKDIILRVKTTEILNVINQELAVLPAWNARYIMKRLSLIWAEDQDELTTGSTVNDLKKS